MSFAAATGASHHARDHLIEAYCEAVLHALRQMAGVPTPEDTWKDIKVHGGMRGELQTIFKVARQISQGMATEASLRQAQMKEKAERGARCVSED